ncbi:hypothetical protein SAMN05421767_14417 [Granulicatella balaenopterae]|uniref:Putative membrane protein insertion efficiency factor n=1 Tax=Granulicatella balaenopterae TaxID=137733 RepID=A0A1H9NS88_9LACT|nr:membrane protein insertion efficiency factor YidD [Granulicatella balaenopterae]SER38489.1 hypothetical protein SAMN05421767_14417 [Granulicatella balaenopterae]
MFKKLAIGLVRTYQRFISPMFPPSCIYTPSCSNYTIQAIKHHGVIKGSIMGIGRILRCHPFITGGEDPVPDYFTLRRNKDFRQVKKAKDLQEFVRNQKNQKNF